MTTLLLIAFGLLAVAILLPLMIRLAYRAPKIQEQSTPVDLDLPY